MNPFSGTAYRLIGLSHPLRPNDPVYPGDPTLRLSPHATLGREGYRLTEVAFGSHHGTHVDAPRHYLADGAGVESLSLERLVGPAHVIDVPGEPGSQIDVATLARHADVFQPGARVLLRSGWDFHYRTSRYYQDYPGLTLAAARWIREQRIALLGLDTPSPSHDERPVHEALFAPPEPVVVVESMTNLGQLPEGFLLAILPLELTGVDGAPARAVALVSH